MRRKVLCSYPHLLFPEKISCLAWIMGETGLSGGNPGFAGNEKCGSIELFPNDFLEIRQGIPRFAIRLHFGLRSQKGPDDRAIYQWL